MKRTDGIYLLLGTNLGDRQKNLKEASALIEEMVGPVQKKSSVYETAAWGETDQPAFLNQVILVSSILHPEQLLEITQGAEIALGRTRTEKWKERIIDIDILYYNNMIIDDELHIPHPEIPNRRFTLVPLVEVSPQFVHPALQKTQQQLLDECEDNLEVKKWP